MAWGRRWAYAGLAALVVVNAVLIVLLLRPEPPGASAAPLTPSATPTAQETAAATDVTPSAEPVPEPAPLQPEPTQRLLAAASEREAWRAVVGACDVPGSLEHTSDAGVTWTAQPLELAPVGRLKSNSATTVFAIGGGVDCAPSFRFSGNAGQSFTTTENELGGSWYLVPASRAAPAAEVHGPRASTAAPCATGVVDLAGLDNNRAALLCTDGAIHTTGDGGSSWAQVGSASQALAIAPADDGYLIGAVDPACPGLALQRIGADGSGLGGPPSGCAPVTGTPPGQVALASVGGVVWVWSGDSLARSLDNGATW